MYFKVYDTIANTMSPRDSLVLSYIINNSQKHGYCYSSVDTMAKAININDSTLRNSIKWLEKEDYVNRKKQFKRGLQQTNKLTPTPKTYSLIAVSQLSIKYTKVKSAPKKLTFSKTRTPNQEIADKIRSLKIAKSCLIKAGFNNPSVISIINDHYSYLNSIGQSRN
ncbi:MAG TPA: helix-turn-helix domain-containing protein [Methylotenera sp.]|nr:helix-turn-helix domain-containing protein [Methylotenera sp.]HPH06385.1 helix-turn-helix domain-containing protein [Methylotenera sp.]HPN01839.1 helix-turn-helix domain-containing protein [Methylotenera sp.]